MEFERAIFRVYERCVEGLRDDDPDNENNAISSKSCRIVELLTFFLATFFLFALIYLHVCFVGQKGCLPSLLALHNNGTLKDDQILQITVDSSYSPDDAGVRDSTKISDDSLQHHQLQSSRSTFLQHNSILSSYKTHHISNSFFHNSLAIKSISLYDNDTINNRSSVLSNTTNSTTIQPAFNTSNISIPYFDYEFSFHVGELVLPQKIRKEHNFKVINITMSGEQCFGSKVTRSLLPLGGIDTVIVNNLMFTFRKPGYVITSDGDYYDWNRYDIHQYKTIGEWILFKILVLFLSVLSFFLLSSATALLVRVLISSGVVLLLPIFYSFQLCGVRVITNQIIRLSYPWIGIPLEMLRARNQSVVPFLIAHITRIIIYYVFYEACQVAFSMWFYSQQQPGQRELWLFAIMMLWEYFGMIYVRSRNSIHLFPRATFALYLMYHFYLYSNPYGFHVLALLVMFLYSSCIMTHCVRKYELQAYYRGIVNIDRPRMLHNTVTWPTWSMALAPDFTLFLPVTEQSADIYTNPVPNRDVELGNMGGANAETPQPPPVTNTNAATTGIPTNGMNMSRAEFPSSSTSSSSSLLTHLPGDDTNNDTSTNNSSSLIRQHTTSTALDNVSHDDRDSCADANIATSYLWGRIKFSTTGQPFTYSPLQEEKRDS